MRRRFEDRDFERIGWDGLPDDPEADLASRIVRMVAKVVWFTALVAFAAIWAAWMFQR